MFGSTLSAGISGPAQIDMGAVEKAALAKGVVIESGAVHFLNQPGPKNFCRLGVSSIPTERIEPGIMRLAEAVKEQMSR